jgi:hypothetical protein
MFKWFQIRIVHRIIATNVILKEMGVTTSDKCSFCNPWLKDSIVHLLWNCDIVKIFWQSFETSWINVHCKNAYNIRLSECYNLVETNFKTDRIIDLIVLLAKQCLYNCKYFNELPLLHVFKKKIAMEIYCYTLPIFAKFRWRLGLL